MVSLYPLIEPDDLDLDPAAIDDLLALGVPWLQLRGGAAEALLRAARRLAGPAAATGVTLMINDHAEVACAAGVGVHVGQDDLSVVACRAMLGPKACIGLSTHNADEIAAVVDSPSSDSPSAKGAASASAPSSEMGLRGDVDVDYMAIGPVFATSSKAKPRPTVGLDQLADLCRQIRARRPGMPIVAIGGITEATAPLCLAAGASAVAAISSLRSPVTRRLDRARIAEMAAACRVN